jgi:hypothetical protein
MRKKRPSLRFRGAYRRSAIFDSAVDQRPAKTASETSAASPYFQ